MYKGLVKNKNIISILNPHMGSLSKMLFVGLNHYS